MEVIQRKPYLRIIFYNINSQGIVFLFVIVMHLSMVKPVAQLMQMDSTRRNRATRNEISYF